MRSGAVAAAENVTEVRFYHDARGVVLGETAQLPGEPLAGADDGRDEILKNRSLQHHSHAFQQLRNRLHIEEVVTVISFITRLLLISVPGQYRTHYPHARP